MGAHARDWCRSQGSFQPVRYIGGATVHSAQVAHQLSQARMLIKRSSTMIPPIDIASIGMSNTP